MHCGCSNFEENDARDDTNCYPTGLRLRVDSQTSRKPSPRDACESDGPVLRKQMEGIGRWLELLSGAVDSANENQLVDDRAQAEVVGCLLDDGLQENVWNRFWNARRPEMVLGLICTVSQRIATVLCCHLTRRTAEF